MFIYPHQSSFAEYPQPIPLNATAACTFTSNAALLALLSSILLHKYSSSITIPQEAHFKWPFTAKPYDLSLTMSNLTELLIHE